MLLVLEEPSGTFTMEDVGGGGGLGGGGGGGGGAY